MAIKYFDILKQYVNTGKPIPEYQLEKVMGMPKGLAKSYFRARINMMNADEDFNYQFNLYEVIFFETLIFNGQPDLIKNLNYFSYLLYHSQNREKLIKTIIDVKGDNLLPDNIYWLLIHSENLDKLIKSFKKDKIYDCFKKLEYNFFITLLMRSRNPDELVRMIIDVVGDTLDLDSIGLVLNNSQYPDESARMIIDAKGDTLESEDIYRLLKYSRNPDELVRMIIDVVGDTLDLDSIGHLFVYSSNPDEIKQLLLNAGVSKDVINEVIENENIETNLIP
jgi:hypothetical protein